MKERSPDKTAVSISLPKDLLAEIDARARSLGMTRSRYLTFLAQQDLTKGGPLVIPPRETPEPAEPVDFAAEISEFLKIAIPALAEYERSRGTPATDEDLPEAPEALADSDLWEFFLEERDEILELKWIESEKAGHDIGLERAIQLWLHHRANWVAAHKPED